MSLSLDQLHGLNAPPNLIGLISKDRVAFTRKRTVEEPRDKLTVMATASGAVLPVRVTVRLGTC
jgi:hypothetical protein